MGKNPRAELAVNEVSIKLNPFAEQFLARTVVGAVSSLRGTEDIRELELYLPQGDVRLVVNGNELPLTPFPKEIFTNTITGLVSSLKGVGRIDTLKITVKTH
ncbi:MAG: hypothetical protein OEV57_02900 [Dehalococcoidia bacterium]|nr:hypothetical protein [Dehalococcoidia bacterium]MDH4367072.1 hypothetical protein [Dehalococcoidia bacterium]